MCTVCVCVCVWGVFFLVVSGVISSLEKCLLGMLLMLNLLTESAAGWRRLVNSWSCSSLSVSGLGSSF